MSIARDIFFALPLAILFVAVLFFATGVGGSGWTISANYVRMHVAFWQFSNKPPNSASVDDAITFLIILHSTCTGPFLGGIDFIGVLDFGLSKKYPHALLRATGYEI